MKYGKTSLEEQFVDGEVIRRRQYMEERVRVKDQKQELIEFMRFRSEHPDDDDICFRVEHTDNADAKGFYYVLMSYSVKVL